MSQREPLSQAEKERVYQGKLKGYSLAQVATEVGCSLACARKWWRLGRDQGLNGLRRRRRGRGAKGYLTQFDPRVADLALNYKRLHPKWGAARVLLELSQQPELKAVRLPKRSRLTAFFKAYCPELVVSPKPRSQVVVSLPRATEVHEVWQLDNQENIQLNNGEIATICNIRDPGGAAMLASQAFSVKTSKHWRKLNWVEVRQVFRGAFIEWQTLPDEVLTDNELGLAGGPNDPYPGWLTLWLVGLGIKHRFIRPGCPTDQPQIERNHRTLDGWTFSDQDRVDLAHLQHALDRERGLYNHLFPCRASDCAGRPPLLAHPELLKPRRPFQPALELVYFDLQRVYDYLTTFSFTRKVSASAQVSLGRQIYGLGKKRMISLNLDLVRVHFDASDRQWVFCTETDQEFLRRPLKGLDLSTLTGLDPLSLPPLSQPVQLPLPFG